MQLSYTTWYGFFSAQGRFQTVSSLTRNPMTIDIHGDRNRAVPELFLNVPGALMGHQKQSGISVPQVMGIATGKPSSFAHLFNQPLDLALAVGSHAALLGIDEQQINAASPALFQVFFLQIPHVALQLVNYIGGQIQNSGFPNLGVLNRCSL